MKSVFQRLFKAASRASTFGLPKGAHITRYKMYQHLSGFKEMLPEGRALSISGSEKLCRVMDYNDSAIQDASYPETNILDLPYEDGEFDCVVSDQVLEHVKGNPQKAIDECFRVVRPGGYVVHTTCFINPIHLNPSDYWRFTPDALRLMTEQHGEVIDSDGWGNPLIWPYILTGLRFEPIPHSTWHPLNWLATFNHPNWPVITWVLARKHAD